MSSNGWIKLHRKITEWEWYDDINTTRLFIHLLLIANHEPKKWHGISIDIGQILTSYSKLSEETKLSVRKIRTSIKRLKSTSEVTSKTTSKNTIITICNYSEYQLSENDERQGKRQGKRQASDKQVTTNKNNKNIINNIYIKKTKEKNKKENKKSSLSEKQFEELWKNYPKRLGSNSKAAAKRCVAARMSEGTTFEELLKGTQLYCQHCDLTGKTKTELVLMAPTFFGRDKHFLDDWEVNYGKPKFTRKLETLAAECAAEDTNADRTRKAGSITAEYEVVHN